MPVHRVKHRFPPVGLLIAILATAAISLPTPISRAAPIPAMGQAPLPSPTPEGAGRAADLEQEGLRRIHQGDATGALDLLNQALLLARTAGDGSREASILLDLGVASYSLGHYAQALDDYQQALTNRQAAGDSASEAQLRSNIGIVYLDQGEYDAALAAFQQALSIRFRLNDRAGEGETLNGLGAVYLRQGEYARALSTFQLALADRQTTDDHAGQGETLSNIALTYSKLGQNVQALATFQQALDAARATEDRAGEEETLNDIGLLYLSLGQSDQALVYLQQSLDGAQALGRRADEGQILDSLGNAYTADGQLDQAETALQQALTIERDVGDRADEGATLIALGRVELMLGQLEQARSFAKQAQELAANLGDRTAEGAALDVLGQIAEQQGDLEQALLDDSQAIAAEENVRAAARLEDFKIGVASQTAALYERTVLVLLRLGRTGPAFDMSERARARSLLDQLGNAPLAVGSRADPQLIQQVQSLRAEISALDSRLRQESTRSAGQQDATLQRSLSGDLTSKEQSYSDAVDRLRLSDPESASLVSSAPLRAPEVQALLDDRTSILSYLVTPGETVAFVITGHDLQAVELPIHQDALEAAVRASRRFTDLDRNAAPDDSLQRLYAALIAPLRDRLTTPQVGIIPYGILNYLSFAALVASPSLTPDRGSGGQTAYLADQYTLFSLPSASVLPFVRAKRKSHADNLLAIAEGQVEGFPVLANVDEEASAVAGLYGGTALTGSDATQTAFEQQAGNFALLHLAAHGDLNSVAPLFSRILLAPDDQNDGSLTVRDVYELDLAQADLVVLSACQTQTGGQNQGDDFVSLSRAFTYAGSASVVASLWSVDDASTRLLMTSFYTHLKAGMSKAAALQAAQADTRTQYPNPFYWAAFVLTGDPGGQA